MSHELLATGSHATHPLRGVTTVYVVGWPGVVEKDSHREVLPGHVVAHTPAAEQMLTLVTAGLGVLQLNASNFHAPGATNVLTIYVPEDVVVQERPTPTYPEL